MSQLDEMEMERLKAENRQLHAALVGLLLEIDVQNGSAWEHNREYLKAKKAVAKVRT